MHDLFIPPPALYGGQICKSNIEHFQLVVLSSG